MGGTARCRRRLKMTPFPREIGKIFRVALPHQAFRHLLVLHFPNSPLVSSLSRSGSLGERSSKTFKHLKAGSYVLYVRAIGPGGADKSPRHLRIQDHLVSLRRPSAEGAVAATRGGVAEPITR